MTYQRVNAWVGNIEKMTGPAGLVVFDTTSLLLDALNESVQLVGRLSITDQAAGVAFNSASKIHWRSGTTVTWNADSVLTVGLQDVDLTTGPSGRGDGTFDVSATISGAGSIVSSTSYATPMTVGAKTLSHGDMVAAKFELTTLGTTPALKLQAFNFAAVSGLLAFTTLNNVVSTRSLFPLVLDFVGDGTVLGVFDRGYPEVLTIPAQVSFGAGVEHGMWLRPKTKCKIDALLIDYRVNSNIDTTVTLYTNPGTTPSGTVLATIAGNAVASAATNYMTAVPFAPKELLANTDYVIALGPSGNTGQVRPIAPLAIGHFMGFGTSDLRCSRATSADPFVQVSGEQLLHAVRVSHVDDGRGAGRANYSMGI